MRALFRAGVPAGKGKPARTSFVRTNGGWFGAQQTAPDVPRDTAVLGEEDENRYVAALERSGFFGPDSWYMNAEANTAFAARAKDNWRLAMPVLFLHGAYDYVCEMTLPPNFIQQHNAPQLGTLEGAALKARDTAFSVRCFTQGEDWYFERNLE